jgi:hypothetical protein
LVLNQGLEFLSSERGAFIRNRVVDEVVKGVDALGRNALHNFTYLLRERVGLTAINETPSASIEQQQTLEHIKRIFNILQETRGFDAAQLVPQLAQLVVNPGVQRLGQQVTSLLVQKAIARLIREFLAPEEVVVNPSQAKLPARV